MKISLLKTNKKGFTLVELLVSMVITLIIVSVLVYLTGVAMDKYRDTRNEVRAARQAKEAIDTLAKDLESLITRIDGNGYEWVYAGEEASSLVGPASRPSGADGDILNRSEIIFFSGATDRYNGDIGGTNDNGGDVSCVSYRLVYKDQITDDEDFAVFSMYRHLINPDDTFTQMLAKTNLSTAYSTAGYTDATVLTAENFLIENIYELTITFLVEFTPSGSTTPEIERVTLKHDGTGDYQEFRLRGNKILAGPTGLAANESNAESKLLNGRLIGAEISVTVLSDRGMSVLKNSGLPKEDVVLRHGYQYTKSVVTPRP